MSGTTATRGRLTPIADGVWSFPSSFSAYPGGPDSTGYVIEASDGMLTVVDPGWNTVQNLAELLADLAFFGRDRLACITGTHLHLDHLGMAAALAAHTGAPLLAHADEVRGMREGPWMPVDAYVRWGVPVERRAELELRWTNRPFAPVGPAVPIDDGAVLPLAGRRVEAVHTPGHTGGHLCFVDAEARLLFCGDHVLERLHPGIGLGGRTDTNPLTDYLASLDRVIALAEGSGGLRGLPGHGHPIDDVAARAARLGAHHRSRTEEIADALDGLGRPTLWELTRAVRWSGGADALSGYALGSALSQTELHVRALDRAGELRDAREGGTDRQDRP